MLLSSVDCVFVPFKKEFDEWFVKNFSKTKFLKTGINNILCQLQDVTGHVTGLALTSVNKFLSYNMIDDTKPNVTSAVENLADAVTHAR